MKIHGLGHSSFLLEMQGPDGVVRILGDPWLSDHAIGDLMGRVPRVRIDGAQVGAIDGIYLSHSHTDHLDPYSLLRLWKQFEENSLPLPVLLLPRSIEYLQPVLEEYLPGVDTRILTESEPVDLQGLGISGLFNMKAEGTNEDDVMMLHVESEHEVFLAESDAVFPFGDVDGRQAMTELLCKPHYRAIGVLAIRNELDALMASMHAKSADEREELVEEARQAVMEEIDEQYQPLFDEELWEDSRLLRLIGGQGICFPQQLNTQWNRVLFPIPLEERAAIESEVAASFEHGLTVRAFEGGSSHTWEGDGSGQASHELGTCEFLELLDQTPEFKYDPATPIFENFPDAPLTPRVVDRGAFEPRLLEILNGRFLPWLTGRRQPPLEHLLEICNGSYRVRVRYGAAAEIDDQDYEITFGRLRFEAVESEGAAEEIYWACDLDDYLDGRCDDFSTFCRHSTGGEATYLWDCLGMPFLNNDLIEKKLRWHFERARAGESLEAWVLGFYG